ncbi:epoxide hydrolase [Saccharopolyspora karakumensis]|uniref:Epoxide hydrolase n=1 Tax=Saccharopolyspora karakumensis TaxID=2530386 RepID=A0A4R5BF49_9PSEU|nr:epoxide hydrolase family protein [Saccharopolyspora karakumensis]TDD83466.1 epoxide hydrolase [Saccharopolyspora karakumensis]
MTNSTDATGGNVRPFSIHIPDERLAEVRERVEKTWWPSEPKFTGDDPWYYGADLATMKDLARFWLDEYDWREHEAHINSFPQFMVGVGDGQEIHTVHVRSGGLPVLVLHGWPNSFHTYLDLVGPMTDPAAHGAPEAAPFDVILPSLPGYAFSPCDRILSPREVASMMQRLMTELGYDRYIVVGGDWGAHIASLMGHDFPENVIAIHIDHSEVRHAGSNIGTGQTGADDATAAEVDFIERETELWGREGAYCHQQLTRPQSLAFAMTDSPVGAAAWLVEKWYAWADVDPETFLQVFSPDRLLTEVLVYILPDRFVTATWLYTGCGDAVLTELNPGERVEVPVSVSAFPDPAFPVPPREFIERSHNVVRYTHISHGGHYPGIEAPEEYVADIREFVAELSRSSAHRLSEAIG